MVVGGRRKFYKDFADDADARFFHIRNGYCIKFFYDFAAHFTEGKITHVLSGNEFAAFCYPFLMNCIDGTGFFFVGAHPVDTAHEDISEYGTICETEKKVRI